MSPSRAVSDDAPGPCVFSVSATKRRRFIWAAWWTGAPTRKPFRPPDACAGGARSVEEARAAAERAAGQPLREIDGMWLRAWLRVQRGLPAWVDREAQQQKKKERAERDDRPRAGRFVVPRGTSPFAVLGVAETASADEIKRAFRRLALATHPDRGGDPKRFMLAKWAHDEALARGGR